MKPHAQRFNSVMDIKFPPVDNPHGEVKVYHLSKEEIQKKYGPSPMDIFTKELYYKFRRNGLTQQQMAKETGLTFEQVKYIVGHYVRRPVVEESEAKKEVRNIKTKSLKKFTREEYLALKEKKIPDSAIRKHFGVYDKAFCDWKHKHGLIGVRNKRGGRFEIYG